MSESPVSKTRVPVNHNEELKPEHAAIGWYSCMYFSLAGPGWARGASVLHTGMR